MDTLTSIALLLLVVILFGFIIIIIIIIITITNQQNFIHRFKKIDYLQIEEYECWNIYPIVHSSRVRKRIVVKWVSKDY